MQYFAYEPLFLLSALCVITGSVNFKSNVLELNTRIETKYRQSHCILFSQLKNIKNSANKNFNKVSQNNRDENKKKQ